MNDDPIKENNPFRIGLDNLTGDDDINSGIEYSDLHDCSNDLSDRGSRREEIEHARFAEQQRRNQYKNTYSSSSTVNRKVVISKNPQNIIIGIIVAYIAFNLIATLIVTFFSGIGTFVSNFGEESRIPDYQYEDNYDYDNDYNYDYSYEDSIISSPNVEDLTDIPEYTPEVEVTKNNIYVNSGKTANDTLIVKIQNKNSLTYYNSTIQVIFYDAEDKPIEITDVSIYALPANQVKVQEIYNLPNYSRYDIYFPDRYNEEIPYVYELQ